jgi:hypothetical protein
LTDDLPFFTLPVQLWKCSSCGGERQWGLGVPYDPYARPWLFCESCARMTLHDFSGDRDG